MIIKNILSVDLTMPVAGIVLSPSETITGEEIGDSSFLASCSDEITTFAVQEKIKVFHDDGITELSVTEIAVTASGENNTLTIGNLDELADAVTTSGGRRFMFLTDSFNIKKNDTVKKPFPGRVASVSIRPIKGSVYVQAFSDGIYFQKERVDRNKVLEYEFDYKMSDSVIIFSGSSSNRNVVEIYIDGDTYLDSALSQELINGWREDSPSHSVIDKYMFDA